MGKSKGNGTDRSACDLGHQVKGHWTRTYARALLITTMHLHGQSIIVPFITVMCTEMLAGEFLWLMGLIICLSKPKSAKHANVLDAFHQLQCNLCLETRPVTLLQKPLKLLQIASDLHFPTGWLFITSTGVHNA